MTCFAAALPIPSHHLPGSALATGIRDALVASSFRAHMLGEANPSKSKQTRANQSNSAATQPDANQQRASQGPDLELVALLRSLVLEVLTPPPVAELLPVHQPACAGGRWCVKGEDLVRFTGSELSCSDFVMAALGWAGHPVRVPWRLVRSWKVLGRLEGGVWLTLQELKAVARFVRGWPGERLRRALA
ncbi:hypothetical protein [Aeromonas rivipollensis]|uniref:hypothetical protein n=1 Tax=Aeromonas rivipollensis TaxID=948519 RepID=UPI003D222315